MLTRWFRYSRYLIEPLAATILLLFCLFWFSCGNSCIPQDLGLHIGHHGNPFLEERIYAIELAGLQDFVSYGWQYWTALVFLSVLSIRLSDRMVPLGKHWTFPRIARYAMLYAALTVLVSIGFWQYFHYPWDLIPLNPEGFLHRLCESAYCLSYGSVFGRLWVTSFAFLLTLPAWLGLCGLLSLVASLESDVTSVRDNAIRRLTKIAPHVLTAGVPGCWLARNLWKLCFRPELGCGTAAIMERDDTLTRIVYFVVLLLVAECSLLWAQRNWKHRWFKAASITAVTPYIMFLISSAILGGGVGIVHVWGWADYE